MKHLNVVSNLYSVNSVLQNIWYTIQDINVPRGKKRGYLNNPNTHCFSNSAYYLAFYAQPTDKLVLLGTNKNTVVHSIIVNNKNEIQSDTTLELGGKASFDGYTYTATGGDGFHVRYIVIDILTLQKLRGLYENT